MDPEIVFAEIERESGELKVVWEWIGEGFDGDYDDEDPADQPLLRFSVYARVDDPAKREELGYFADDPWIPVEEGSYCTTMPTTCARELLEFALELMLQRLEDAFQPDYAPTYGLTRTCEELTYLEPRDVERAKRAAEAQAYAALPEAPEVGEIGERTRPSGLAG